MGKSRVSYEEEGMPIEEYNALLAAVIAGNEGQIQLRKLFDALTDLPHKRLIRGSLCDGEDVCLVGAYVVYHRVECGENGSIEEAITESDTYSWGGYEEAIEAAEWAGLDETLAWELMNNNDEVWSELEPEERYEVALAWVKERIEKGGGGDAIHQ